MSSFLNSNRLRLLVTKIPRDSINSNQGALYIATSRGMATSEVGSGAGKGGGTGGSIREAGVSMGKKGAAQEEQYFSKQSKEFKDKLKGHLKDEIKKHEEAMKANKELMKDLDKTARERIDDLIKNSKKKVFVFMKGVPEQPACGYSNAVIQILNAYEVDYDSFNVLDDDEIRQEIKVYSNWPTIPQVYVDKNFVGGCDILIQMYQSNELEKLFGNSKSPS